MTIDVRQCQRCGRTRRCSSARPLEPRERMLIFWRVLGGRNTDAAFHTKPAPSGALMMITCATSEEISFILGPK